MFLVCWRRCSSHGHARAHFFDDPACARSLFTPCDHDRERALPGAMMWVTLRNRSLWHGVVVAGWRSFCFIAELAERKVTRYQWGIRGKIQRALGGG